jgi:hypothetical protein
MLVRCKNITVKEINKKLYKDKLSLYYEGVEKRLKINQHYVVYAIEFSNDASFVFILENDDMSFPTLFPLFFFQVVDIRLSKFACYGQIHEYQTEMSNIVPLISFKEWAGDSNFWEKLIDGDCRNIFLKYKKLMDFEFYNPNLLDEDVQFLEVLENNWVMCPICVDGFEVKTDDEMIECPQCCKIYVNPLQKVIVAQ